MILRSKHSFFSASYTLYFHLSLVTWNFIAWKLFQKLLYSSLLVGLMTSRAHSVGCNTGDLWLSRLIAFHDLLPLCCIHKFFRLFGLQSFTVYSEAWKCRICCKQGYLLPRFLYSTHDLFLILIFDANSCYLHLFSKLFLAKTTSCQVTDWTVSSTSVGYIAATQSSCKNC